MIDEMPIMTSILLCVVQKHITQSNRNSILSPFNKKLVILVSDLA